MHQNKQKKEYVEIWTREQTLCLINELKKYPCLYNPLHINYSKKRIREEKLKNILEELKKVRKDINIGSIKLKIRTLQSQISKEKMRMKKHQKSNGGEGKSYKSTLWCYDELAFLHTVQAVPQPQRQPSTSNIVLKNNKPLSNLQVQAIEAIATVNRFFEKQNTKQPSREEDFCKYLCSRMKQIKLRDTFNDVTVEILTLVKNCVKEEKNTLQFSDPLSLIAHSSSTKKLGTSTHGKEACTTNKSKLLFSSTIASNPLTSLTPSPTSLSHSDLNFSEDDSIIEGQIIKRPIKRCNKKDILELAIQYLSDSDNESEYEYQT